ncbi:hypothetical protein COV56_03720, partial [Candidatus Kuenenbacteria bacterium CG11_big_fil_rev_8_21_14_0_20_37_9]
MFFLVILSVLAMLPARAVEIDCPGSCGGNGSGVNVQMESGDIAVCHRLKTSGDCRSTIKAATVTVPSAGLYGMNTVTLFDSGDGQLNESYFLTVDAAWQSGDGSSFYVVEDSGTANAVCQEEPAGQLYLNSGQNEIYMNHVSLIKSDSQLNQPVDHQTESVRLRSLCVSGGGGDADPEIYLTKTGPNGPVVPGQNITYSLEWEVREAGVTGLTLVDDLPNKTTFVSASDGGIYVNDTVTWNLGDKNAGDSGTVSLTVMVDTQNIYESNIIRNEATLSSNETSNADAFWENSVDAECVMRIVKTDNPDPVNPGEQITYIIEYENIGNAVCANTIVTETYSPKTSFLSANPMPSTGDNTWDIGNLKLDGPHTIEITVTVSGQVSDEEILYNNVCIDANRHDPVCTQEDTAIDIP